MSARTSLWSRVSPSDDVSIRLDGLEMALDAAQGRLDASMVAAAVALAARARGRLRLSPDHTVVALAGATGSGKSSLFNALCGLDVAAVGVRRPTTSTALACSWGGGSRELLEWLGIPPRHQVDRDSVLDAAATDPGLRGLVLLDLPDHDSTEVAHHLEVERLVALTDMMIWVLDPQKYADAAIHDRFLRPLASHRDVMLVVFNHVDELTASAAAEALGDVRRLLASDGLADVPVIATSATRGDGLADLRSALGDRVEQKRASRERVAADIRATAGRIDEATGNGEPAPLRAAARENLLRACAHAAGVPLVVAAVEASLRSRSGQATGWPLTRWLVRLRPDPLRRLHLDGLRQSGVETAALPTRTSLPAPSAVQRAQVGVAVRGAADAVSAGMSPLWTDAVRRASMSRIDDVPDALDAAVSSSDLASSKTPLWWSVVRDIQWVLLAVTVAGAVWLAALAGFSYLALPRPDGPRWEGIPVPTWLLVGGIVASLAVAAVSRWVGGLAARRRARRVEVRLHEAVGRVVDELVVAPVEAEVEAYRRCRQGLATALRT
ncbi:MAG: GTPase [Nocardioidaceae bacterium]